MECSRIVAIIRPATVEAVEERLVELGVSGISTWTVRGHGEARKLFFSRDPHVTHTHMEVFVPAERAEEIARAIVETAHTGSRGDGLVAIVPVERIWRVRAKSEAHAEDLAGTPTRRLDR